MNKYKKGLKILGHIENTQQTKPRYRVTTKPRYVLLQSFSSHNSWVCFKIPNLAPHKNRREHIHNTEQLFFISKNI